MNALTPVEISEQPWADPADNRLSGTYRYRVLGQAPDTPDHLVLYIRGSAGDPGREYTGTTTICGQGLGGASRPTRVTSACVVCLRRAAQAFRDARAELASHAPSALG